LSDCSPQTAKDTDGKDTGVIAAGFNRRKLRELLNDTEYGTSCNVCFSGGKVTTRLTREVNMVKSEGDSSDMNKVLKELKH
jgi:hypothetical protein